MTRKLFLILVMIMAAASGSAEAAGRTKYKVMIYGDDYASGYGLKWDEKFQYVLDKKLKAYLPDSEVIDATQFGNTTAKGVKQMRYYMQTQKPTLVVLALGMNDMMHAVNPKEVYENLEKIIRELQKSRIKVALVGMRGLPSKVSAEYAEKFNAVYPALAEKYKITLVPYLLEGIAGKKDLTTGDRLHPNAEGVKLMADNLLPYIYYDLKSDK